MHWIVHYGWWNHRLFKTMVWLVQRCDLYPVKYSTYNIYWEILSDTYKHWKWSNCMVNTRNTHTQHIHLYVCDILYACTEDVHLYVSDILYVCTQHIHLCVCDILYICTEDVHIYVIYCTYVQRIYCTYVHSMYVIFCTYAHRIKVDDSTGS
jgi:hypothetical protein